MPFGPIEMLVVKFPGNRFTGDIMPAMAELVEDGTAHIVDLVFVHKDETAPCRCSSSATWRRTSSGNGPPSCPMSRRC